MIEEPSSRQPALRKRVKLSLLLSIASYAAVALSFLLDWTALLLFPICYILAFTAITIAIDQLSSAMKGRIDASSRRLAKASAVLGTASVILMPIGLLQLVAGPDYASPRDVVINDIYNLSAHAYQYRIRPKEMGGGDGSYFGYTLPPKMVKMEFGTYTELHQIGRAHV